jgi:hypothetical protein
VGTVQLSAEMLDLVHNGARPVPLRDRSRYYDRVAAELRKRPFLTNGNVLEAVRQAQREILRPPVEA